jgi:hypothetical protein
MAELGCLASIPSFSRTMPLAWEQPAKGFFHSEPRFALLKSLSAQRCSRRRLRSLRPAPRPRVLLLNHKGRTGGKRKVSDRSRGAAGGRSDAERVGLFPGKYPNPKTKITGERTARGRRRGRIDPGTTFIDGRTRCPNRKESPPSVSRPRRRPEPSPGRLVRASRP